MKEFVGVFAEWLTKFVEFKKSLGYKYKVEADELYRFSLFTTTFPLSEPTLTKEIVLNWCTKQVHEQVRNSRRRAYPVRQFALYLNSMGLDAYIIPPRTNTCQYTFIPYIFTHNEIERILENSDQLCPRRDSSLPLVVPVILRMIYSCGLRVSEAVSLQNKHVNLQEGILELKNSKFGRDRLVPMSESMTELCRLYHQVLHANSSQEDYFFMNFNHQPITSDNVYRRFREVLWLSGISHGGKGVGPRLHDLRHTFAVHTLKRAVDRGLDVYCALPILSTFMGHVSVTATEQYVRLTADAFPDIRITLDQACSHVIPEVAWE